jgi:cilia- and flagella-associated protein 251
LYGVHRTRHSVPQLQASNFLQTCNKTRKWRLNLGSIIFYLCSDGPRIPLYFVLPVLASCPACEHCIDTQDLRNGRQIILQGHTAPITCISTSSSKAVVVTADSGPDSIVVAWDTVTAAPTFTIAAAHANGVLCMDMSQDGSLLVTVSKAVEKDEPQEISLWDVSAQTHAKCLITVPIPAGDVQVCKQPDATRQPLSGWLAAHAPRTLAGRPTPHSPQLQQKVSVLQMCIRFNAGDPQELISNGSQRVYFWRACLPQVAAFKYYSPPLTSSDFKQKIGAFTVSTFVAGTTQALTGTEDGDVIIWDEQGVSAEVGTKASDRKAVKLMRLHLQGISWLSTVGDFIASGSEDGFVRFFDPMLRLVAWFEHMQAGAICSVSFSRTATTVTSESLHDLDLFLCPDFIVGTKRGNVVALTAEAFNSISAGERSGKVIVEGLLKDIACCSAHPMQPVLLVVGATGSVQVWDMMRHSLVLSSALPKKEALMPTCAIYSRTGTLVVMGTTDGTVLVLNAEDLVEVVRVKQTRAAICTVAMSSKGKHIAAATADGYVLLVFLVPYKHTLRWEYIGRTKVHYSPVVAVHFGEAPSGETRCFSLSDDGRLAEYDIVTSSLEAGVIVCNHMTTCQGAKPTAMSFTPPLTYFQKGVIDTQLVIADSQLKIRVFNPDNAVTSATLHGPAFCGPVAQMVMFQSVSSESTFVAFRCAASCACFVLLAHRCVGFAAQGSV